MKKRDLYLTGILLLLVGVTFGTLVALYTLNSDLAPLAEVRYTEITKNDSPLFDDENLANIDARFIFKSVAETVTPSVVYIETIVPIETSVPNDDNHKFDDTFWEKVMPRRARTVGSGVIISTDGYILTNEHVVDGAVKRGIKVVLSDKREYYAKVVGSDSSTDLAVIKIDADNLQAVTVGNSETVDVGEWVLAIGNPFRLRSTVTAGIVSALSRDVQIINDNFRIESFIQTDAAINKGNSGGALVNTSGQLIGINTAIASQSGAYQGYGFAVPSNLAMKVATDLIEFGKVKRALLGVTIATVDYNRAVKLGMSEVRGVEIIATSEEGTAFKSGVRSEDVVLKVNGFAVNESNQLQEKVAVLRPGDTVDLEILRNGKIITKQILLTDIRPDPIETLAFEQEPIPVEEIPEEIPLKVESYEFDLGFKVIEFPSQEEKGGNTLFISKVFKYSEAWHRGLRADYKIVAVDKIKVEDISTLKDLVKTNLIKNGTVTLEIINKENARGFIKLNK